MAEPSLNWAFVILWGEQWAASQKIALQKIVMEKPADKKSVL